MTSENEINIKNLYSLYPNILGILLHDNTTKRISFGPLFTIKTKVLDIQ